MITKIFKAVARRFKVYLERKIDPDNFDRELSQKLDASTVLLED